MTVNDVFLAGVAGGLRRWLEHAGERLPKLRAQIPVSLHHRDEGEAELGNRDSFLNVDLPVDEPDPIARLEAINAQTERRARRHGDAEELYDLFHALSRFKHLDRAAQHLAGGPREFSLSISNVPGPSSRAERRRPAGRAPVLGRRAGRSPRAARLGDLLRRHGRDRALHGSGGGRRESTGSRRRSTASLAELRGDVGYDPLASRQWR